MVDQLFDDVEVHVDVPVTMVNNQEKQVFLENDDTFNIVPDSGFTGLSSVVVKPLMQSKVFNVNSAGTQFVYPDSGYCGLDSVAIAPVLQEKTVSTGSNGQVVVVPDGSYCGMNKVILNVSVSPSYPISSVYLTSIPDYLHDPHGDNKIVRSFTNLSNFEVISGFVDVSNGSGIRLFCNNGVFGGIRPSYTGIFVCFGLDNTSDPSYPDTITVSVKNVAGSKNVPMSSYSLGVWFGGNYDDNSLEFNGNLLTGDYVYASRANCFLRVGMAGYEPILGESVTSYCTVIYYLKYYNLSLLRATFNRVTNSSHYSV